MKVEGMRPAIDSLVDRSRRLLQEAAPESALILRVYASLADRDILRLHEGQPFDDARISELAHLAESSPQVLSQAVFGRTIKNDLRDYSAWCERALDAYRKSRLSRAWVEQSLDSAGDQDSIHFVLHGGRAVWEPASENLSDVLDGPSFNDQGDLINDDDLVVEGYLVDMGRSYQNTVDLCCAAFQGKWDKWEILWRNYF